MRGRDRSGRGSVGEAPALGVGGPPSAGPGAERGRRGGGAARGREVLTAAGRAPDWPRPFLARAVRPRPPGWGTLRDPRLEERSEERLPAFCSYLVLLCGIRVGQRFVAAVALAGPGALSALLPRGCPAGAWLFPEARAAPGPAAPPARLLLTCESKYTRGNV